MPEPHGPWSTSVVDKVDAALTDVKERNGKIVVIPSGYRDLEVQAHCGSDGVVSLMWSRDPSIPDGSDASRLGRPRASEPERDAADELARLARTFKATLDEWTKCVGACNLDPLAPPPPNAKPIRTLVR